MRLNGTLCNDRINLVPPCLELQPQMLEAIIESKAELEVFLPWVPYALTESESIENTKQAMANFANFDNELRYSIIDKTSQELVGAIGLLIKDKSVPYFEIGYWLRSSCVGKGYITDAIAVLEQYAFTELEARRIEIRCDKSNVKSKAVALRCGYEFEGELKQTNRLPSGALSNTLIFAKAV